MAPAFLVGLEFEAAILRWKVGPAPFVAVARQGDATTTRARLEALVAAGADALVSFGIAGALDPALAAGALVMPEAVFDMAAGGEAIATDAGWRSHLAAYVSATAGKLASVAAPVATPAQKAQLFGETGAVAVDMESAIAGRIASAHGLPFLVVRAIADEATMHLPAAALAGVDADGRVQPWRVAPELLKRPGDLAALIRLGQASGRAKAALERAAAALAQYR